MRNFLIKIYFEKINYFAGARVAICVDFELVPGSLLKTKVLEIRGRARWGTELSAQKTGASALWR